MAEFQLEDPKIVPRHLQQLEPSFQGWNKLKFKLSVI